MNLNTPTSLRLTVCFQQYTLTKKEILHDPHREYLNQESFDSARTRAENQKSCMHTAIKQRRCHDWRQAEH